MILWYRKAIDCFVKGFKNNINNINTDERVFISTHVHVYDGCVAVFP